MGLDTCCKYAQLLYGSIEIQQVFIERIEVEKKVLL